MAGIADAGVVDLVAQEGDGRFVAIMLEERPWGCTPDQVAQLRTKLNAYASFITEGQYVSQVPSAAGQRVTVQLRCAEPPPDDVAALLAVAEEQLESHGIGFELVVVDYL